MGTVADKRSAVTAPHSQTLHRGIRVLEILAEVSRPMTVGEIATAVGVHRSIVYRILRTLEDHRLVTRLPDGPYDLGLGLSVLARGVSRNLHTAATPDLAELANDTAMTAFVAVADRDECVTLLAVEPRHSHAHVAYRPGGRHPIDRGAPGIALLSGGPPLPNERPEVDEARRAGFASSRSEVIPGMASVAAVVLGPAGVVAAVAVIFVDSSIDEPSLAARVRRAADNIAAELS